MSLRKNREQVMLERVNMYVDAYVETGEDHYLVEAESYAQLMKLQKKSSKHDDSKKAPVKISLTKL